MLILCYGVFTMYVNNYEFDHEAKMSIQLLCICCRHMNVVELILLSFVYIPVLAMFCVSVDVLFNNKHLSDMFHY